MKGDNRSRRRNAYSSANFAHQESILITPESNQVLYSKTLQRLLTYLLTYLLTPWCRVLLEKLTGLQLIKKFTAFHGTRRFITALTNVRHLSLSWASPIQSKYPQPTSWRSILILSTHLRLGLPSGLLPSGFPTKTLYTPLSSSIRATCPAHLIYYKDYENKFASAFMCNCSEVLDMWPLEESLSLPPDMTEVR